MNIFHKGKDIEEVKDQIKLLNRRLEQDSKLINQSQEALKAEIAGTETQTPASVPVMETGETRAC